MLEIATGEIALFWDTEPSQTGRLARALRADLAQLEAAEFLAKWRRWQTFDRAPRQHGRQLASAPSRASAQAVGELPGETPAAACASPSRPLHRESVRRVDG